MLSRPAVAQSKPPVDWASSAHRGPRAQAVTPEAHRHAEMAGHATASISEVGGGAIDEGNVEQVEADDHTVLVAATRHPDGDDGRCRP